MRKDSEAAKDAMEEILEGVFIILVLIVLGFLIWLI